MNAASYLPSSQFSVIALSILLAGGFILGAQYLTNPAPASTTLLSAAGTPPAVDWQTSLEEVQAEAPGLPEAPSEDSVQALLMAAQSSNVTNSVARSLFINLSDAGAQGLGSDIPTQEKLIASAALQVQTGAKGAYTAEDITPVGQTPASLRAWGNGVMKTFLEHPRASNDEALLAVGKAADYADASALAPLTAIGEEYAALALELSKLPVPSTFSPLYLQLLNNLSKMSAATDEMKTVIDDPLRGLAGLQVFQTSGAEASRVLTTMAEQLRKGGILFSTGEPGTSWNVFVSSYPQ